MPFLNCAAVILTPAALPRAARMRGEAKLVDRRPGVRVLCSRVGRAVLLPIKDCSELF